MTPQNSTFIDVEVTDKSLEELQRIRSEYVAKKDFRNFGTGWEGQRMFYTFWYWSDGQ